MRILLCVQLTVQALLGSSNPLQTGASGLSGLSEDQKSGGEANWWNSIMEPVQGWIDDARRSDIQGMPSQMFGDETVATGCFVRRGPLLLGEDGRQVGAELAPTLVLPNKGGIYSLQTTF
jgi:hypothetical protein